MKDTLILTKILLKNSLNKNINKEEMNFKAIAKKLIIFAAVAYIACVIGFLSKQLIDILKEVNQAEVFISLCLLATIIVAFFRSIISSLNILYFSKDTEFLLPLPISSLKIVFAKFNVMLISEYIIELLTFAIPFGVYGITMQLAPVFYIMAILVFLFLPVIPTLIGIILTVILMNITSVFKNKDIVQYISVFFAFAIVIGCQIFTMQTSEMTDFMFANKLVEINGLSSLVGEYFIILKQSIIAITKYGQVSSIQNIIYLIVESIITYLLVALLVSKSYIKSATNVGYGKIKKVKDNLNNFTQKNVRKAYVQKELKSLFRNPVFFLNTILPIIIIPIVMVIPFLTSNSSGANKSQELLLLAVQDNIQNSMGFAICLNIINLLYMFNYISVTSISRDGENAIFMKYIPIELHKQCRYKAMPSFIFNLFSMCVVVVAIKMLFKEISNVFLLEIIAVSLICNAFISYVAILIDILKPKLHWTTEHAVVKQNMNMLWETIFILITIIIIFAICSYFENVHIVAMLLSAILIFTIAFYDNFLKVNSTNIFRKIS